MAEGVIIRVLGDRARILINRHHAVARIASAGNLGSIILIECDIPLQHRFGIVSGRANN